MAEGRPWNPWRGLRDRDDVIVLFGELPEGLRACHQRRGRSHVLVITSDAGQVERNHLLAHELVHIERGGGCPTDPAMPEDWRHSVTREERRVEDEAVRRLVPLGELRRWVVQREQACEHVEVWLVAEEWHVPEEVAERAMRLLYDDIRQQIGPRDA